jgi:hypothetical protein
VTYDKILKTIEELYSAAFYPGRTPRSDPYKKGVMAALKCDMAMIDLRMPFAIGTAEADAWLAGVQEGLAISGKFEGGKDEHDRHDTLRGVADGCSGVCRCSPKPAAPGSDGSHGQCHRPS